MPALWHFGTLVLWHFVTLSLKFEIVDFHGRQYHQSHRTPQGPGLEPG